MRKKPADQTVKMGFPPVFDQNSEILILGSFPSVKSREISFYYGNKQNRFWRLVCGFFGEEIPADTQGKKEFLHRRHIALWDVVTECKIVGSADSSIREEKVANLQELLSVAKIRKILLNGTLAYQLFEKEYADLGRPYYKMPSTSPANPRFSAKIWEDALDDLR